MRIVGIAKDKTVLDACAVAIENVFEQVKNTLENYEVDRCNRGVTDESWGYIDYSELEIAEAMAYNLLKDGFSKECLYEESEESKAEMQYIEDKIKWQIENGW